MHTCIPLAQVSSPASTVMHMPRQDPEVTGVHTVRVPIADCRLRLDPTSWHWTAFLANLQLALAAMQLDPTVPTSVMLWYVRYHTGQKRG